jgi:hypothetical protein
VAPSYPGRMVRISSVLERVYDCEGPRTVFKHSTCSLIRASGVGACCLGLAGFLSRKGDRRPARTVLFPGSSGNPCLLTHDYDDQAMGPSDIARRVAHSNPSLDGFDLHLLILVTTLARFESKQNVDLRLVGVRKLYLIWGMGSAGFSLRCL